MEEGDFWSDNAAAQKIISECNLLKGWTLPYRDVKKRFEDAKSLLEEVEEGEDLYEDLVAELKAIEQNLEDLEIKKMLSGELDS